MCRSAASEPEIRCHLDDDAVVARRAATGLSRRSLLAGAVGAGVAGMIGLAGIGSAAATDRPRRLSLPGSALDTAGRRESYRVHHDGGVDPIAFTAPEEGEILFPIAVAEGDHCGVLDNFGECRDGCSRLHVGVDIMADEGLPIRAVVDGVLTRRTDTNFYGWTLLDETTDIVYRYFHNTADANGFEEGDFVRQGDIIGFVGDTGTSEGNFHLHFEYRPNNVPVDCYDLLQRPEHVLFWG